MKTKWLKAFKSLKPASGSAPADRRNGAAGSSSQPLRPNEDGSHHLQEYTYKKITACDVCSQILRGHTRQGLRCRICKLNAHGDCASQLPRCQPKQKLLRRQKSTSELENRVDVEEEIADTNSNPARPPGEPLVLQRRILKNNNSVSSDVLALSELASASRGTASISSRATTPAPSEGGKSGKSVAKAGKDGKKRVQLKGKK